MPDLLIGRNRRSAIAEVKTGTARLKPGQVGWWDRWRGNGPIVLRTVEDVARLAAAWDSLTRN